MKWMILTTGVIVIIVIIALLLADYTGPALANGTSDPETIGEIPLPQNYVRVPYDSTSFGNWIRNLPLKAKGTPVRLFNGRKKPNQKAHYAVIDLDVGNRDLQQCADAAIRILAEYLYANGKYDEISFNFTSGDTASFRDWIEGYRPDISGNEVAWVKAGWVDSSYENFRKYLDVVFTYAGSYSLSRQLKAKENLYNIESGDIILEGGFPGHAVIVVDIAVHEMTDDKIFLLAQSFMPAQDIHILKNPNNAVISPWYSTVMGDSLRTPEWTFARNSLMTY